ncbi:MAG: hypothetical protein QOI95_1250 [Acidimicrobiaceae bacterium]|jgi:hypothetical protein
MTADSDRLARAIAAIDSVNADDPETIDVRGERRPKEQAHAEMMTEWVRRLDPAAVDAQILAARAHHLRRWSIPRASFPEGRQGYLRWRTKLKKQHAEEVGEILQREGYEPDVIELVQHIVRKDGLKTDAMVQTHEDALCLVFLETQLLDLARDQGDDKTVDIIRKTVVKMSEQGIEAALALDLPADAVSLVGRALASAEQA